MIPFEYDLLSETYENLYRTEENTGSIVNVFTLLAIIISCMGLFGLIVSVTERRTKEIGIRKVLGGSLYDILYIITRDFMILVGIASLMAWPIAYFVMDRLLQNYAYRINLNLWVFAVPTAAVILISFTTVIFLAFKAATANPVHALRHE
jgi:putative ABC transport system permease protein